MPAEESDLFSNAFTHAAIGMCLTAPDGRWLDANAAACRFTGYSREELLQRDFQSITHPDDLSSDLQRMQQLLAGERDAYQMEKRYVRKDGQIVWGLLSVSLVRRADGQPRFFIAQIQDIDARKRVENELETFFALSRDLFSVAGADARLQRVSGAWARVLGWREDELLGSSVLDILHPSDVNRTLREFEAVAEGRRNSDGFANRYRCKGGGYRWLEWNTTLAPDGRFYGVARDITTRLEADERLRVLERAVASSDYGLMISDLTGSDDAIEYVNPRFEAITGYTTEDIRGRNSRILQRGDREQPEIQTLREAIARRRSARVVLRNYRKNGQMFMNDVSIAPVYEPNGSVRYYVGVIQDVTERFRLEQDLQLVIDRVPFAVLHVTPDYRLRMANQRFADMVGIAKSRVVGRPLGEVLQGDDYTAIRSRIDDALAGDEVRFERMVAWRDGAERAVHIECIPESSPSGEVTGCLVTVKDVTEDRRVRDALEHQARHDALTGVLNRRGFELALDDVLRGDLLEEKVGHALCVIDLDGFKPLNDHGGHALGDSALRHVAQVLDAQTRAADVVARIGGDEFAVVLCDCSVATATEIATTLVHRIAGLCYRTDHRHWRLGASAGVVATSAGDGVDALLRRADEACYRAKHAGGDCVRVAGAP